MPASSTRNGCWPMILKGSPANKPTITNTRPFGVRVVTQEIVTCGSDALRGDCRSLKSMSRPQRGKCLIERPDLSKEPHTSFIFSTDESHFDLHSTCDEFRNSSHCRR